MSPLPLTILLTSVVIGSAQEVKSSRVRFPNEQQHHNNGPQVYESESQAVPIIIRAGSNGLVNGPHYVIPKVPSAKNPFGDISTKGYAEGVIIPHANHHPVAQQQEFHQTVPPPKTLLAGHPQSFVLMRQQAPNQGRPNLQQQQQKAQQEHIDRHRFSIPSRLPYHLVKPDPSQGAFHQIFASGMAYTKDAQKHPDVASYRYSIVDNHGKPRPSQPDEFEMEINHGIPDELMSSPFSGESQWPSEVNNKHNGQYFTSQKITQKPKDSNKFSDFPDFDQGFHDWPIKSTYHDIISQSNRFNDKNKKGNKQSAEKFPIPNINHNEDFSSYDDFPDFPSLPNQNNERFSYQRKPEYERGQVKASYKPIRQPSNHETKRKTIPPKFAATPSFETVKSIELAGGEMFSDENISPAYNYQQLAALKKHEKPQINFNSQYFPKTHFKKPQKQQNNEDIKFSFNYPQRPERVKKPQKQSNFDYSFDFTNSKPMKKQHKQHRIQQNSDESDYQKYHSQQTESLEAGGSYGSDWIPINAPEGVVPAKSYEIPPPNLSRSVYNEKHKRNYIKDWPQQQDDDDYNRFKSSETDTVYGVQKGLQPSGGYSGGQSGEEVVSATFRVKQ